MDAEQFKQALKEAGPAPDGPTEEELAADAAEMELYRCRLEEKRKLEAMLCPINWEGTVTDEMQLTWWSRLRELELELEGKTTVAAQSKCICLDVVSAGARGTIKCGATYHSECVIRLLQDGAQQEYEFLGSIEMEPIDKACPSCSHNMITGGPSAKMQRDQQAREADARRMPNLLA
eukprot:SAG11_NODE_11940_length_730_cov_1.664025_1_plen_176_part_10